MPRILLLEDDDSLGRTLAERLERERFTPVWARSIASAKQEFEHGPWDLAILDVRLPDGCGFALARDIRRASSVPIMFMTALDSAENRLEGSEIASTTYLPKPFHFKELLIRVRLAIQPRPSAQIIREGDLEIDLSAMTVRTAAGDRVFLQARDTRVLALLVDAAPRAVGRSEILDAAWGADQFPTSRGVDNAVVRLRQALGDDGARLIRSVRGVGYQWTGKKAG
jgi:DNA-binding response OmpR family regulator